MSSDYCGSVDVKAWLQIPTSDSDSDTVISGLIPVVSRWIDGFCGEVPGAFGQLVETRTFEVLQRYLVDVDPIADTSGLVVKTDAAGDGTFETTWLTSDFELLPQNAAQGAEPKPWRQLRAVGSKTWPVSWSSILARRDRVQVTATFGWPQIPVDVSQACVMQTARMFTRRKSADGIVGETSSGFAVRVPPPDRDVVNLLHDYILGTNLVVIA